MAGRDLSIGVTIDGYSVEGGYDVEGSPTTSFLIAQSLGRIAPSLRSAGTYEHLGALVERAAKLGCAELRVTLEWARLERRPGERDATALGHYLEALTQAKAASLRTVVVLCDAAWPSWLGQEPWLSAWAPQRFAAHAAWLAPQLDELASAVVTFRAPNTAAWAGWRTGSRPPFRRGGADALSALDGMLVAHQRAVEALSNAAPSVTSAILLDVAPAYEDGALWLDVVCGRTDPVVLAARRERWLALCARHGVRFRTYDPRTNKMRRRSMDVSALRSSRWWSSTPSFECWLGGSDLGTISVALEHADGTVPCIELGAGSLGWDTQLGATMPAIGALHSSVRSLHLHGLVSSTGPLQSPVGLVEVDHRDGGWRLGVHDEALERRLTPNAR